jgi:parvulin-like peptidyl-prolyl isomerase
MARRKSREPQPQRELTRKEVRHNARTRERDRKLWLGVGIALGIALLIVIIGAVTEFLIRPNSAIATVGNTQIVTRDYWKRIYLQRNSLQNQYIQLSNLEQQFGGQGFFTAQLNRVQGTLSSPFALGVEVLDQMINEQVVRQEAAARGITVSPEEVEEALRAEVANADGLVTATQAEATAEAGAVATATAASWTPTPTPTIDANAAVTATMAEVPTPEAPPPSVVQSDVDYQQGLVELQNNLQAIAGMSLEEYRTLLETRLLQEKLVEAIAAEQVATTDEQVHARHILLRVTETTPEAAEISPDADDAIGEDAAEVEPTEVNPTDEMTATTAAPASEVVTTTDSLTQSDELTPTQMLTVAGTAGAATELTATASITATGEGTPADAAVETPMDDAAEATDAAETTAVETEDEPASTPVVRDEEATLALAQELRQRILAGEDFAALAAEYSEDTSNAGSGGDLGWFGRGAMVAPFEEAAFALEAGEISEPVRTSFGYHLIEVLERDAERPKDENQIQQEKQQAFSEWLRQRVTETEISRPNDLLSYLPRDLRTAPPVLQPQPQAQPGQIEFGQPGESGQPIPLGEPQTP